MAPKVWTRHERLKSTPQNVQKNLIVHPTPFLAPLLSKFNKVAEIFLAERKIEARPFLYRRIKSQNQQEKKNCNLSSILTLLCWKLGARICVSHFKAIGGKDYTNAFATSHSKQEMFTLKWKIKREINLPWIFCYCTITNRLLIQIPKWLVLLSPNEALDKIYSMCMSYIHISFYYIFKQFYHWNSVYVLNFTAKSQFIKEIKVELC